MLNFVDQLSMNGSSVELEGDYVDKVFLIPSYDL